MSENEKFHVQRHADREVHEKTVWGPSDDEADESLPLWAGLLPLKTTFGAPMTTSNATGIPTPSRLL